MSDTLRAGIIGAGFIGTVHAHAVRAAGSTVQRVVASTPQRTAAAASRLGAQTGADSVRELIEADDVDVVHVCTPNSLHLDLASRAIEAGKPVICEKPLAVRLADAGLLADRAAAAGVVASVPFVYRFYPGVRAIRSRVAAGEGGPLHLMHGSYLQDWQVAGAPAGWRGEHGEGGEFRAFADIGVHWCDLVEFVSGQRIAQLSARTTGSGAQTTMQFTTDRGVSGSVVVSQVAAGHKNGLILALDGFDASYRFDQENPETVRISNAAETRVLHRGSPGLSPRQSILPPGHPQGYQDCFNAFVADTYAAIGGDTPDGLPTFADGLRAARLTDAVVTSSQSSTWVEVPS
ncbi:Gfo/Idh/MocA family oxidoreductase [Pseudonocardia sp.]|uniref:Gfo/Idh/MocA family protein n=1 Tax=Pseudonocardia sp. TaxID=60912 RepID=UPI002635EB29|nr:Gfo/Idh/MocA family oxidoreductase [Pseudonocardia sp.]